MVSISHALGPTNSFSDEVFTTDSDAKVWAGLAVKRSRGVAGDGLSVDALRKNKSNPPTAEYVFYTRGGLQKTMLGDSPPPIEPT